MPAALRHPDDATAVRGRCCADFDGDFAVRRACGCLNVYVLVKLGGGSRVLEYTY